MKRSRRSTCEVLRAGCLGLVVLALSGCTIEVGPPPESDPPLVPPSAKPPPPPPQPTEPQAWSQDLDLESGPTTIDRRQLAEGLVASDAQGTYSGQRLTFESAFQEEEKEVSEAERLRQRARERAEAAGLPPPPEVAAAPVEAVTAEPLPSTDGQPVETTEERRQSRLPPPPKFPPVQPAPAAAEAPAEAVEMPEAAGGPGDAAAPQPAEVGAAEAVSEPEAKVAETADPQAAAAPRQDPAEDWSRRNSRLPAPPKFPPPAPAPPAAVAETDQSPEAATPGDQLASAEPGPPAPAAGEAGALAEAEAAAAKFTNDAWDPPTGTILVQVAAVQDESKVNAEWQRLQSRYPAVLQPLRLVVEKAMLGERAVFYRVQAGGFGSEAGAAAACETLVSEGQPCFVVVR